MALSGHASGALLPPGTEMCRFRGMPRRKPFRNALVHLLFQTAGKSGVILGYGGTNSQQIHDGIRKLRMCVQSAR